MSNWNWFEHTRDARKPRISKCEFTRKWIVNSWGDKHVCNSHRSEYELGFGTFDRAVAYVSEQHA